MDSSLSKALISAAISKFSNPVILIMFSLRLHPTQPLALLGSTAPRSTLVIGYLRPHFERFEPQGSCPPSVTFPMGKLLFSSKHARVFWYRNSKVSRFSVFQLQSCFKVNSQVIQVSLWCFKFKPFGYFRLQWYWLYPHDGTGSPSWRRKQPMCLFKG